MQPLRVKATLTIDERATQVRLEYAGTTKILARIVSPRAIKTLFIPQRNKEVSICNKLQTISRCERIAVGVETQWEESRQWEQFQQETYSSGAAPRGEQPIVSMTVSLQPDSYSSMQYSSADQMSATQNRDADGGYDTNSLSTHRSIFILLLLMLPERIQPLTRTNA